MVGLFFCYINDGDYIGGFFWEDIDDLIQIMESNYFGWLSIMVLVIMGVYDCEELGQEFINSFC